MHRNPILDNRARDRPSHNRIHESESRIGLFSFIRMSDQVKGKNLECQCESCKDGTTQHVVHDDEFEFDFSIDAHWAFARTGDAAGDLFLDTCEDLGLLHEGPYKVHRLFEFGQACEALGDLEDIQAAMQAWKSRDHRVPGKRDRSPKRKAAK